MYYCHYNKLNTIQYMSYKYKVAVYNYHIIPNDIPPGAAASKRLSQYELIQ